jgi:hypothetical protein
MTSHVTTKKGRNAMPFGVEGPFYYVRNLFIARDVVEFLPAFLILEWSI